MEATLLKFSKNIQFTDDEFYQLCLDNPELKFERTKNGNIIFIPMANTG